MKLLKKILWLSLPALLLACSNDETNREDNGGGSTNPDRREIVIELQNGLRPATSTRADIAEADENRVQSLDIYVFACPEEEGQYTFADQFCYRADNASLPAGAQKLDFKYDETNGQARVVFYPRKGLYCHFFCVANSPTLCHENGTPYTLFQPLTLNNTDGTNPVLSAIGYPTESDFLRLLPPSLTEDDVLRTPLMMSGSTLLPIDLRAPALGSSIRLNMRLTRTVARFDVVNNALQSHLTITSISLDRGRRCVSLFPIAPLNRPDDELMTYADVPFDGPTANLGTTTKAFYCYPSPATDGAALIIKGRYALNQTDAPVEVSYRIPFKQTVSGTGARIDIIHNHRYTLQITQADSFELDYLLKIEDWADEGSLDQNLDNELDELKVSDLKPDGKTVYNPLTGIITLNTDATAGESSFTVQTASNAGVVASLDFVMDSPDNHWLKIEEMIPDADYQHKGSQAAKFKVSLLPDYAGKAYPRAVMKLTDGSGKFERMLVIQPEPYPAPSAATPIPGTAGERLNLYDPADQTLHLYRVKGSTVQMKLSCPDGTTVADNLNSWLEVKQTAGTDQVAIYTLTLTDPGVVLPDDRAELVFSNRLQPDLQQTITLQLHEAEVTDLAISDHNGLSTLDATQKEVDMTVTLNSRFRLSALAYDAVQVEKIEYVPETGHTQVDEWLEYTVETVTRTAADFANPLTQTLEERMKLGWERPGTPTTSATSTRSINLPVKVQSNLIFRMKSTAQYFGPATVTLKNTCLGPDLVLKVQPEYPIPVVNASTPMTPEANNYDDANKTLYLLQQADGKSSTGTLSVYAPGGSTLVLPADISGLTLNRTSGDLPTEKYTLSWSGTNSTLADHDVTLQIKNASNNERVQSITVKALSTDISDLTLTPKETGSATLNADTKNITLNVKEGNSFTLAMKSYGGQVKVESCPSFLTSSAVTRGMPSESNTSMTFTLKTADGGINGKGTENLVLSNPCGGPKLTLKVTPIYTVPVVSGAGTMTPANANKWDATENTLYLVQQAAGKISSGVLTIYSLGGSTIELPAGVTATPVSSDEKSQQYTLNWAGSNAADLTEQNLIVKFKNKSDLTKTTEVKLVLLPNTISELALTPKSSGSASLSGTIVTVDIATDNWFKLTMKAYGNGVRVQVKSKPAWLKVSTPPSTRTSPTQEETALIFTVDNTNIDFSEGDLVLSHPNGAVDLTLRVKPKYAQPSYNSAPALGPCNNWINNTLYLIQPRSGSSTSTLRIYSLGGSRAELIDTKDGLSLSNNALSVTALHDYTLSWTPSAPNDGRNDQDVTLRIWNHDDSQYLDQNIKLVANGILGIWNSQYNASTWDVSPVLSGAANVSAGLNVDVIKDAILEVRTDSYGGTTLVSSPSWMEGSKYEDSPADPNTPYATKISSRFHFKIKEVNGSYSEEKITLRPVMGGPDFVLTVTPVSQAPIITAGSMTPSGVNKYDPDQSTVYLLQQAQDKKSIAELKVLSPGGSKITFAAYSGFSVDPASSTNATQIYTLNWTGSDNVQTAQDIAVKIANNSDATKFKIVTTKLIPNTLQNVKLTAQSGGVSLNPSTLVSGTSATLTVPIVKGTGFTVSMDCYSGTPGIKTLPSWLQQGTVTSGSSSIGMTHTFHFDLIENADNFNDTQLVFTNPNGGPELTLTITREFKAPTVTDGGSPSPSINQFSGSTLSLYRVKSGKSSTRLLKVYSLGGSTLTSLGNWHNIVEENVAGQTSNSLKFYRVGSNTNSPDSDYGTAKTYTFNVQNASDTDKQTPITMKFLSSRVTWSTNRGDGITTYNTASGTNANQRSSLYTQDSRGIYNQTYFDLTVYSPAGVTYSSSGSSVSSNFSVSYISQTTSGNYKATTYRFSLNSNATINNGGTSLGRIYFSSDNDNFYDFYFDFYNYVPVLTGIWGVKVTQPYGSGKSFYICKSNITTDIGSAYLSGSVNGSLLKNGWRYPGRSDILNLVTNEIYWSDKSMHWTNPMFTNADILFTQYTVITTNSTVEDNNYFYGFYFRVDNDITKWKQDHPHKTERWNLFCIHD